MPLSFHATGELVGSTDCRAFKRAWPMSADRRPANKTHAESPVCENRCADWSGRFICLAKVHGVLALSEICKGIAIVAVGDLVIADEVGELISVVAMAMGAPLTDP
jgi:hypothetical protein